MRRRSFPGLRWAWVATLLMVASPCAQQLVIEGATLIDGTGAPPVENATIVISDGKFESIVRGDASQARIPPGAQRIDARGKYVIPGLIDNHSHFIDWQTELFLAHGVTTVLDLGNVPEWIKALKEAVAKGKMRGPRIYHVGRTFDGRPTPGHDKVPPEREGILVYLDTRDQARREIRKDIEWGADCIKIYARLSPEVLRAICDEAHKANIPVAGHTENARDAALAGVDFLEHSDTIAMSTVDNREPYLAVLRDRFKDPHYHGGIVYDEAIYRDYPPHHLMNPAKFDPLIDVLVRQNSFFNVTLLAYWKGFNRQREVLDRESWEVLSDPRLSYIPLDAKLEIMDYTHIDDLTPEARAKLMDGYRKVEQFTKAFVQKGGKVVAGVDAVGQLLPGLGTHQEMWLLVQSGLTPMQALLSATKWSAEMMRKDKLLGTIEVGKFGDLVILEANPLQEIRNTRRIQMVIQGGKVVDRDYHSDYTTPIPRPYPTFYTFGQPHVTEVQPILAVEGSPEVAITVKGTGFSHHSVVLFDGVRIKTAYREATLTATIPSDLLKRVGTFPVAVWNPRPGGGTSNPARFIVKFR
ncbi:MAG: amidohydrolase family protein [Acidobacteria bacterium]|nr:amidohydrolase family protein [Acidobacteriota bacterium]